MDILFRRPLRHLALATLMAALAACGGSETKGPELSTGILSDGPIQGVEYLTTGNLGGSTNASGQFSYRPGETIVFKIGLLPIGVATGSGSSMTVTPLQLIQGFTAITDPVQQQNAVTNLLVLLQSLDTNPDPARITIAPGAITTLQTDTVLVDALTTLLTDTPANFSGSASFATLLAAAGTTAVTPANALAHFREQFLGDLAGQYYGTVGDNFVAIRFRDDGSYLMTEVVSGDPGSAGQFFQAGGQPGLERGTISWDPSSGQVSTSTDLDTNGSRGFSAIDTVNAPLQISLDAGSLVYTPLTLSSDGGAHLVRGTSYRLARLADSASGVSGTWAKDDSRSLATPVFFLLPDGNYVLMDPVGDTSFFYGSTPVSCGSSGVELGSYAVSGSMLQFGNTTFDSNGCAGARNSTGAQLVAALLYNVDTGALLWSHDPASQTFYRANNTVSVAP